MLKRSKVPHRKTETVCVKETVDLPMTTFHIRHNLMGMYIPISGVVQVR